MSGLVKRNFAICQTNRTDRLSRKVSLRAFCGAVKILAFSLSICYIPLMTTLQQIVEKPAGYRIIVDAPREDATLTRTPFDRITQVPGVMGGKPTIRGMRVTVGMIVGQIAERQSVEDILAAYPYLEPEDIHQSLQYAAWLVEGRNVDRVAV
jgi:uncharacterized protein (DUF433 family)